MFFTPKLNGIVIENRIIDFKTNQISIKMHSLSNIPNSTDTYQISFAGVRGYHSLETTGIPDENNILTFTTNNYDFDKVKVGTRVKIKELSPVM